MDRYMIVRFYQSGRKRTIETGLTLEEAQAHCSKPSTKGKGWFEGFQKQ